MGRRTRDKHPLLWKTNQKIGGNIMKKYKVLFEVKGLEESTYNKKEELIDIMGEELLRVYNIYADKTNSGVTDMLNQVYDSYYMSYLDDNEYIEARDEVDYNKYMAFGYQCLVVNDFNKKNISSILDFYVDTDEVVLTGRLKLDRKVTISFRLREV